MARPTKIISDFDICLGRVVKSKRVKAGLTRTTLYAATGIPEANIKRREEGRNEITTSELYRIAHAVGVMADELVEEALKDYGGMDKLLAEHMSEASSTIPNDLQRKRADKEARFMGEGFDEEQGAIAANLDAENEEDEPSPT